eukprot:3861243-Prymnesium_polylepis.1
MRTTSCYAFCGELRLVDCLRGHIAHVDCLRGHIAHVDCLRGHIAHVQDGTPDVRDVSFIVRLRELFHLVEQLDFKEHHQGDGHSQEQRQQGAHHRTAAQARAPLMSHKCPNRRPQRCAQRLRTLQKVGCVMNWRLTRQDKHWSRSTRRARRRWRAGPSKQARRRPGSRTAKTC